VNTQTAAFFTKHPNAPLFNHPNRSHPGIYRLGEGLTLSFPVAAISKRV
jgi:hypothetical protein